MAVGMSPARKQVREMQSAKSTRSLACLWFAGSKSRISEMLISLRGRRLRKSALSSKLILVSLHYFHVSYHLWASAWPRKSGRIYDLLWQWGEQPFCRAAVNQDFLKCYSLFFSGEREKEREVDATDGLIEVWTFTHCGINVFFVRFIKRPELHVRFLKFCLHVVIRMANASASQPLCREHLSIYWFTLKFFHFGE